MPITPILIGEPFEPEDIRKMSEALGVACAKLRLAERADPLTEMVARKIIEFRQRGVRDPDALAQRTLSEFEVQD
jgi:hypothetical protein